MIACPKLTYRGTPVMGALDARYRSICWDETTAAASPHWPHLP